MPRPASICKVAIAMVYCFQAYTASAAVRLAKPTEKSRSIARVGAIFSPVELTIAQKDGPCRVASLYVQTKPFSGEKAVIASLNCAAKAKIQLVFTDEDRVAGLSLRVGDTVRLHFDTNRSDSIDLSSYSVGKP